MTIPTDQEYSVEALIAINEGFIAGLVTAGSAGCTIKIYDSFEDLVSTITLSDPPATVDVAGLLTFSIAAPDEAPSKSSNAAYGEIHDAGGTWFARMPTQLGSGAVARYLVMNSLTIIEDTTVNIAEGYIG